MFDYYPGLYTDLTVKDTAAVLAMIGRRTAVFDAYVLCVSPDGRNLMDIFSCAQFLKQTKRGGTRAVVGIANGRAESRRLFLRILTDYLEGGHHLRDFKAYFTGFMTRPEADGSR